MQNEQLWLLVIRGTSKELEAFHRENHCTSTEDGDKDAEQKGESVCEGGTSL